ncbi:GFA family protein [Parvularcula sp. IMCC14364]|uniref:GFA family protein n=1 Tax=Parvularcula sp. IMCC14364 TaxID=3067902 RepID=UPI0027421F80|nr:GFA family protein [Parvularcula sp. IMCC14364]
MPETVTGKCLCGKVSFQAQIEARHAGVCHCTMCQKWAGGITILTECQNLKVDESPELGLYRASEWGERGFCRNCGASLFWRMQDGSHANVSVTALDGIKDFTLNKEIFIDEKPEWHSFEQNTKQMTGAEVIALFTEGQAN